MHRIWLGRKEGGGFLVGWLSGCKDGNQRFPGEKILAFNGMGHPFMGSQQQLTKRSALHHAKNQDPHGWGWISHKSWHSKMSRCSEQHGTAGRKPVGSGKNPLPPRALHQPLCPFSQIYWADWFYCNLQILDQLGTVEVFKWRSRLGQRGFWRVIHRDGKGKKEKTLKLRKP